MRTIFETVEYVWHNTQGWCSWEKAQTLASLVIATRPELTVEVGVWFGRSLLPMAVAHRSVNKGRVVAVDPWKAKSSVEGQISKDDQDWWNRQDIHEQAHDSFVSMVREMRLPVDVMRMSSDDYDPHPGIGILHIDGNHGEQAIKDMARYAPCVVRGGYLIADDLDWTGGAVKRGIELLPGMGFEECYRVVKTNPLPGEPTDSWALFRKL